MSDVTVVVRMEKKVFSDGFYVYAIVQSSTVSSLYDIFVHTRYIDGTVQFLRVAELTDVDGGGLTAANLTRVYVPTMGLGVGPIVAGHIIYVDTPWPFNWGIDLTKPYFYNVVYQVNNLFDGDGKDLDVTIYNTMPLVPTSYSSYYPYYNEHIIGDEVDISIYNVPIPPPPGALPPPLIGGVPAQILYTPAATTTWLQRAKV
jgi:hypothetical protein